ncbi:MAG: hypothetical protein NTZ74_16410 [Chloroflexi bacterium]|nr:hypothetical protein [Chloroflexota bacterium]
MGTAVEKGKTYSGFFLLSVVLMVVFIITVLMPVEPSDYWTFLRIGDEIVRTQRIPTTEFMTYTQFGKTATFSYWLASLLFLEVYKLGGIPLTVMMIGFCIVAFYTFVWLCLREQKLGPISASLILFITALMGSNNWSTRPQVFAYPLFGLTLWVLLKWLKRDNRFLFLLPLIAALWVNLHGSFVLQFLLLLAALIFGTGDRKKLFLMMLFTLAATLLNPFGLQIWMNFFIMVGNPLINAFSTEWFPPVNQGWQLNLFFASLLITPFVVYFSPIRGRKLFWAWFFGFGWMALTGLRFVIWFSIIEALLLAELAGPRLNQVLDRRPFFQQKHFNLGVGILLLVFSFTFLPGVREFWWNQSPPVLTDTTPVDAVGWIDRHPELPDHLWANWTASIYMSYALPDRKVWNTNRIEDFSKEQLADDLKIIHTSYDWQEILDHYQIKSLLLDQKSDERLLGAVSGSSSWTEVYRDGRSVVFVSSAGWPP